MALLLISGALCRFKGRTDEVCRAWQERILKENNILIYPRPNYPVKEDELPETVRPVHSPVFEISSTFIRKALDTGKDIRYFLHPAAWEYIKTNLQYYSVNR